MSSAGAVRPSGLLLLHDSLEILGGAEKVMLRVASVAVRQVTVDLALIFRRSRSPHCPPLDAFEDVIELGFPPNRTPASIAAEWRAHRRLVSAIDRSRSGCVAFSYPSAVRAALARRSRHSPLVWVCQEDVALLSSRGADWRRRIVFRLLRHACSTVVCLNREARSQLEALGFSGDRLRVIRNGAPKPSVSSPASAPEREALRRRHGIPPCDLVITCVAHLNPVKNHELLIAAVRLALDAGVRVVLVCVGGEFQGRVRGPRLRALAHTLGVDDLVVWTGVQADVSDWLRLADAAVLASVAEAAPLALLEAAALGVALVGSDAAGIREVITAEQTGLLFPPGDAAGCAAALVRLAGDPSLRAALGLAARDHVAAWNDTMHQAWETLVNELVSSR